MVTYDPRGLGRSTGGDRELSLHLLVSDVKAVLEALHIEKAALLGASMGALVALRFALDFPESVAKLVVVSPGVVRTRYGEWFFDTLTTLRQRLSREEYAHTLALLAFAPPFFQNAYGMVKEVTKMLVPSEKEFEQIGRQLACLRDIDISSEVFAVDAPTLIIAGERDVLAPIEGARLLAAKVRHSRLVSLPDVGHSPFVEATDEVVRLVTEFLAGMR